MSINVLDLLRQSGQTPRSAGSSPKRGPEWVSPCPGCGGRDRFHVWPDQYGGTGSYWCRQCDKGGDNIQFLMDFRGLTFLQARGELGIDSPTSDGLYRVRRRHSKSVQWTPSAFPGVSEAWREHARKFVEQSHAHLLGNDVEMAWLENRRGISRATAERFKLGWNPEDFYRTRESWGLETIAKKDGKPKKLWIPRGLVIPVRDRFLQIRRPDADLKSNTDTRYFIVPGSDMSSMRLNARAAAWVVVESRLDAILLWQSVGDLVGILCVGTGAGKPDAAVMPLLDQSLAILVALDFDDAGMKGAAWWLKNFRYAKWWPVSEGKGKDPGEAWLAGLDLRHWILAGLPPAWTLGRFSSGLKKKGGLVKPVPDVLSASPARAASVSELYELLQNPVRIKKTVDTKELLEAPAWAEAHYELSQRISKLVFFDDDVRQFLSGHPDEIIGRGNFFYAAS